MNIAERLMQDLATSMKAGDTDKTGVLRLLRSSLKNEQIKAGHELSDDEAMKVLQREAKQRRDSIEQYRSAGREDLAAKEEFELTIVDDYLPQALSEDELRTIIDEVVGENTEAQMGAVIGAVMQRVGARAEGGTVSRLVRERLGQ